MGSTPTQQIKADLNGTGTLVDITSYVDQKAGIKHPWGRTDWTSSVQPPGGLTITLENLDGRFTPGSTAVYTLGVVKGMCVEWTCGARVRRFYVQTPALTFPSGVAGNSRVTLQCLDALSLLANRTMQSMLVEETLLHDPVAYWPLDDTASEDSLLFREISGKTQPPLFPAARLTGTTAHVDNSLGDIAQVAPAQGRGPRTDGVGALVLNGTATGPVATFSSTDPLGMIRNVLEDVATNPYRSFVTANNIITLADRDVATSYGSYGPLTWPITGWWDTGANRGLNYGISMWFSIKDIYGAAVGGGAATDGPYVHLATINVGSAGGVSGNYPGISILWRIADRKLILSPNNAGTTCVIMSAQSYSVSPSDVHHLAVVFNKVDEVANSGTYSAYDMPFRVYLDGAELTPASIADTWSSISSSIPKGVMLGAQWATNQATRTGADQTVYAFSGTVAHVSLHGPSSITPAFSGLSAPTLTWAQRVWDTGTTGPLELADARFTRLGGFYDGPVPLVFSPQGTPQVALLGPQSTAGKSILTAMCEALAGEEASFDTVTVAGVDTVRAWLDSNQRSLTPILTVDIEKDAEGLPELSYDGSGVATKATASGWSQSVTWVDDTAPTRWAGTDATVAGVVNDLDELLQYAAYRTVKGRVTKVTPTRVTVDAITSTNNLTATLLTLRPGHTIRLAGLPSTQLGYSTMDCILVGVTENHTIGRSLFDLTLIPRTTEMYFDPGLATEGPWRFLDMDPWVENSGGLHSVGKGSFTALRGTAGGGQLSSSATTGYILTSAYKNHSLDTSYLGNTRFSTDSADYPLNIKVDNEIITLPNAPSAVATTTFTWDGTITVCYQQVTGMLRGQFGTTAAVHGSTGFWTLTSGDDCKMAIVYADENQPLLAF